MKSENTNDIQAVNFRKELEGEWPEGIQEEPTKDENIEIDQDKNMPWPDPDLIGKWWIDYDLIVDI